MNLRQTAELQEKTFLCDYATLSSRSAGRPRSEEECDVRMCFARDRDRIIHSKAFRRLKHKTQVFMAPEGDHYRTRLTHTLEVAQIARVIARACRLNEDLAEAAALGHDLGHPAFGHSGEEALNNICTFGFKHNEQSLRLVDFIEKNGAGLNLTNEVRDGILCHTGDTAAKTPEGRIIHFADRIAYVNHDIDDTVRAGIIKESELPKEAKDILGASQSERINSLVRGMIDYFDKTHQIGMPEELQNAMMFTREYLFDKVYRNSVAKSQESKCRELIYRLYEYYHKNIDKLPNEYLKIADRDGAERAVCDYISGMTDTYAIAVFSDLFIPRAWAAF